MHFGGGRKATYCSDTSTLETLRLRWERHLQRQDGRLPKDLLCSALANGIGPVGCARHQFKDVDKHRRRVAVICMQQG